MKLLFALLTMALLSPGDLAHGQNFGLPLLKSKVTLQRKLPAFVQLPGIKVKIVVTAHANSGYLTEDFKSMLGSELLKDDPRLEIEDAHPDSILTCTITDFEHPKPTTGTRPGVPTTKGATPPESYTRVTGLMRISFLARTRAGRTIGSDNVVAKYDEEFDTSGNTLSGGVPGMAKNTYKRLVGGAQAESLNPPTDSELRNRLLNDGIQQIVVQVVNTREFVPVQLAKGKGIDKGVKEAEAGLWSRALETWEAAPPLPRPIDDAYRLYDVGVAYEAMGYASDNDTTAVKYLQQASIQYGKAIDQNPGEKYFLGPQRRIETALAHYSKLEDQKKRRPSEVAAAPASPSTAKKVQR